MNVASHKTHSDWYSWGPKLLNISKPLMHSSENRFQSSFKECYVKMYCAWFAENASKYGSMQKYRSFWGLLILLHCLVSRSWLSYLRSHFCLGFFLQAQLFRQFSTQPFNRKEIADHLKHFETILKPFWKISDIIWSGFTTVAAQSLAIANQAPWPPGIRWTRPTRYLAEPFFSPLRSSLAGKIQLFDL